MGKNLAAACSKLIKWVRSYQISYLILNLYHLRNTKFVFFQVSQLKVKTCLNRRLFMKTVATEFRSPEPQKLTKSNDMTRSTFSKLTWTFKLHQWTQTKTKIPLWQRIKLILVMSRGLNRKEMYLWAKLYCIMPALNAFY